MNREQDGRPTESNQYPPKKIDATEQNEADMAGEVDVEAIKERLEAEQEELNRRHALWERRAFLTLGIALSSLSPYSLYNALKNKDNGWIAVGAAGTLVGFGITVSWLKNRYGKKS